MMPAVLRKSLLAVAISTAALPALAETLTFNGRHIEGQDVSYGLPVTVSGTYTGTDYDAISFDGGDFFDGLSIDAQITVNSSVDDLIYDDADALDLGRYEYIDEQGDEQESLLYIHGDLVNKGSLSVNRLMATGINLDGTVVYGDVINDGTVQAKGNPYKFDDEPEERSVRAIGLYGASADNLINNGSLVADGPRAQGVFVNQSELLSIINNGNITATGEGSNALRLNGSVVYEISNYGTLQADGTAIVAENPLEDLYITQYDGGLISGGVAAIQGNGNVIDLGLFGGTIRGNLLGIDGYVDVMGNVTFDGNRIETTKEVGVYADSPGTSAHLELLQAHTVIDGDLTVYENASLGLNLSSATGTSTPVLQVTGNAEFDSGSQIQLKVNGSDFTANGTTYTLLQAGSLVNNGLSVTSSSSLLNINTYQIVGNQIVAQVTSKNTQAVGNVIANAGGSRNAQAAGANFSQVVTGPLSQSSPNDPVRQAFIAASEDPIALAKLSEQLAPEVSGGGVSAAVGGQTLVSNAVGSRTDSGRGLSSGDTLQGAGVWVQGLYSDADQSLRDGIAGYNAHSRGVAVGADGKLNDNLTLGLAYSYLSTNVNGDTGNKTEVDGHAITLYSGLEQGNWFLDGGLTVGRNDNSGKRQIAGTTAKGDYNSDLLGANLVGGYTYRLSPGVLIEPRVAARYSRVEIDRYSEKGSSAALRVDAQRYEVAELGAGLRAAASFVVGQGRLEPQLRVMGYHDLAADQAASTSTFVLGGTPFVTSGAKPARNSLEAGIGTDYKLGALTLGVSYDYLAKSDFNADTFTAKVRYDF